MGGGVIISGGMSRQPSPAGQVRPDVRGFNVPLDRDKFAQLILSHPTSVIWEKAIRCPRLAGPSPEDHDPTCEDCHMGYLYFDSEPTDVFMQSMSLSENYYAYGRNGIGRVQVTALPEYKMSFWDRLTLCNSRSRATEYVVRKKGGLRDRLKYAPLCVDAVMWKSRDSTLTRYTQNVDFTVDDDTGELVWSGDNRPDLGSLYSVAYWHRPQYIVIDVPRDIRDLQVPNAQKQMVSHEFCVQVVAQRDSSIYREAEERPREGARKNPFPTEP